MYMRHPPPKQGATHDFFLGGVKIQPNFDASKIEDQDLELTGGTGKIHIQLCYRPQQVKCVCIYVDGQND